MLVRFKKHEWPKTIKLLRMFSESEYRKLYFLGYGKYIKERVAVYREEGEAQNVFIIGREKIFLPANASRSRREFAERNGIAVEQCGFVHYKSVKMV